MVFDRVTRTVQFLVGLSLLWLLSVCPVQAKAVSDGVDATIGILQLPKEGQETYRLIHQGGPFPYEKDGVVFGNRERLLSPKPRGYYHEYTVKRLEKDPEVRVASSVVGWR